MYMLIAEIRANAPLFNIYILISSKEETTVRYLFFGAPSMLCWRRFDCIERRREMKLFFSSCNRVKHLSLGFH
jgi:hypothetical protein